MRTVTTKRSEEKLVDRQEAKQAGKKENRQTELHVSKRPQFRASNVIAHALALYNLETTHTVSQTMNMALREFLPARYIARAEQLLTCEKQRIA